jgi:DNA-binding NtrC family response regulator
MTQSARARVLLVDDKQNMLDLLARIVGDAHDVVMSSDARHALRLLAAEKFDVVVTDVRMPGADGFDILRAVKKHHPDSEVIVMTAFASIETAIQAMRLGAFDYLQKPFDPDDVNLVLARALAPHQLRQLVERLPEEAAGQQDPAGSPPTLASLSYKELVHRARDVASREYLSDLMRKFNGAVTLAAEQAGIERESLHRLLKRYGIRADAFRPPGTPSGGARE